MAKRNLRRKSKKSSFLKWIFSGGLFFCLLAGAAYFLFFSHFFDIESIEVSTAENLIYYTQEEIQAKAENLLNQDFIYHYSLVKKIVSGKNPFLISSQKMAKAIIAGMPEVESIKVQKKIWQNMLEVQVKERKEAGIWCAVEYQEIERTETATSSEDFFEAKQERIIKDCFYLDQKGIIYKKSPLVKGDFILNIYSQADNYQIKDKIIPEKAVSFMTTVKKELSQIKMPETAIKTDYFEYFSSQDLRMETTQGWQIYFNPANLAKEQTEALKMLFSQEIKEGTPLQYIDLRIAGRAYYK